MITTKETVGDLDVIDLYKELMQTSMEEGSVYIRSKETLTDMFENSNLTDREKAEILSGMLSNMSNSVTNSAMNAAIQLAKENRDAPWIITKLAADTDLTDAQRRKVEAEIALLGKQADKVDADIVMERIQGWNVQANMYRDTGVDTRGLATTNEVLPIGTAYQDYGIKYQENRLGQAKTYDTWAGSVRSNGLVDVDLVGDMPTNFNIDTEGLMYEQKRVAQRQYQAFDDNKRQHAVNSSASMLGVMIGSEAFTDASAYVSYIDIWKDAMNYLNAGSAIPIGTISAGTISASFPATATQGIDYVVTGTTVNVLAGVSVKIEFFETTGKVYGAAGIVEMDGTWTVTVPGSIVSDLTVGTVTAKAALLDATGTLISDSAEITVA